MHTDVQCKVDPTHAGRLVWRASGGGGFVLDLELGTIPSWI